MSESPTVEVELNTTEILPSERRRFERVKLNVPIKLDSVTSFDAETRDVSTGGVFVTLEDILPVGSLVDLEFQIPGADRHFKVLGEVRWSQEERGAAGLGIEFLNLDDERRAELAEVVDAYSVVYDAVSGDDFDNLFAVN